ncbi:MAG: hypothetical protein K2X03_06700 [Bryobacteraceae bacterium]|nr:hypothetical protein [Bryobacteraceae bacterium]
MSTHIEPIAYGGWPHCYRLANSEIELILTADVGPRVIRCGFVGGPNVFKEYAEELGGTGETTWKIRGGHRVWVAPERANITYELDNHPVEVTVTGDTVHATSPVDARTGLQKTMILRLAGRRVTVTNRLTNTTLFPISCAAWGPTVMAPGGLGITGFPPRGTHPEDLEPVNPLVMWSYTDFSDPRWRFTSKYVTLRQDPQAKAPQKLGLFNPHTFGAYLLDGHLFLKQFRPDPSKTYADMGCSYQSFSNCDMLELETMGPYEFVAPGGHTEFVETWSLDRGVSLSEISDASLDALILPRLQD